ncbi:D-TA family PLP-dependent enzyme [Oscillospiraceae bacterium LTW-04]|nr:D-TA family PLP-dependent enzyme [Oscillospiraceae bacterium MB24-C1]
MANKYSFEGAEQLVTPQLVYYKEIIEANIRRTTQIAGGVDRLWPHVKSHKMAKMVELQMSMGITRFKCATIAEAEMVAAVGCSDALVAYPLIGPNITRFLRLSTAYPTVRFWAIDDDTEMVLELSRQAVAAGCSVRLLMDMDMGMHRTGVALEKAQAMYESWAKLPGIEMRGMHCYDGNRHENDFAQRDAGVSETNAKILKIREALQAQGIDCSVLVMGGTPSFPCHAQGTKEFLSPGTGIIQDAGYRDNFKDLDFTPGGILLTRVISRTDVDAFTLDLGYKAVAADPAGERAEIVGMEYAKTVLQNEEHWVVRVPPEYIKDIPPVGTLLYAIPTHICPTSALYPSVPVVQQGRILDWWEVTARNRKLTY